MPRGRVGRPLRFALVGLACAGIQIVLLTLLEAFTSLGAWANAVAFFFSAQANFVLSRLFTWNDRLGADVRGHVRPWVTFNGVALAATALNQVLYVVFLLVLPYQAAAALAILVLAVLKYLAGDRLVFTARQEPLPAAPPAGARVP